MAYISIADFAERASVTPQAIYRRLKTDLKPYLKEENGVKLLSEEALQLFNSKSQQSRITELEALVSQLKEEKLALTEKLAANNQELLDILKKQTELQENYQVLLAQSNQLQQALLNPPKAIESTESVESDCAIVEEKPKRKFLGLFSKRDKS